MSAAGAPANISPVHSMNRAPVISGPVKLRLIGIRRVGFGEDAIDQVKELLQAKRFRTPRRGGPGPTLIQFLIQNKLPWSYMQNGPMKHTAQGCSKSASTTSGKCHWRRLRKQKRRRSNVSIFSSSSQQRFFFSEVSDPADHWRRSTRNSSSRKRRKPNHRVMDEAASNS